MLSKNLVTLALAAALATGPVSRAAADAHGLIGAIIGGAIVGSAINNANKNKRKVVRTRVPSATRVANRETQTALNYFGYPAGTPDGVLGRRSRAAISSMQAYMGFPVTGQLTQYERDILVGAYHRGISGTYETTQLVSKDPDGVKALLVAQRDLMSGGTTPRRTTGYAGMPIEVSNAVDEIADSSDPSAEQLLQRSGFIQLSDLNGDGNNDYILDTSFSGSSFWCNAVQCKTIVFASSPNGYSRNDLLIANPTPASFRCTGGTCVVNTETVLASTTAPVVTTTPDSGTTMASADTGTTGGALPLFAAPSTSVSLDSHCSKVSLLTNANGGFTQAAAITDPNMVMNEQLCLARAYSIETGERLVADLGVTMAQAEAQCAPYGPALKDYVASLSLKPRAEVVREIGGFVLESGMDPAQLANTAKICLAAGYRMDNMNIALGTGMLLVVLGEAPYGELMGHHLSQGFGASARLDLAMPWYNAALDSLSDGAQPVFAPNQVERPMLLQAAVDLLGGGSQTAVKPIEASGSKAKLPTIGKPKN